MTGSRQWLASARLDLGEVMRSRWIWFCVATYIVLGCVLVVAGTRESTIVGFTGTTRVLLAFSNALILVLPLIALTALVPVVQRAREDGTLELLLSQPLSPGRWLLAACTVRYLAIVLPLAVVMIGIGVWGRLSHGDPIPWDHLARSFAVFASLLLAFSGIGAAISVFVRNSARATTYVVLVWALGVALLDFGLIGLMLRWRMDAHAVFAIAIANPVEAARISLLSELQPDLSTFGPVGFYVATKVGSTAMFAIGVIWPATLGVVTWLIAYRKFSQSDRV